MHTCIELCHFPAWLCPGPTKTYKEQQEEASKPVVVVPAGDAWADQNLTPEDRKFLVKEARWLGDN